MARIKLQVGAELDVLNREELSQGLAESQAGWFRELARGLKVVRFPQPLMGTVAGGAVIIGGDTAGGNQLGPREGFVWMVKRVSVLGDQTTDVVTLWRGDSQAKGNFVANIPLTTGLLTLNKSLLLHPGEVLTLTGTSLTSSQIFVAGEAIEAPGPMVWKLL